MSPYLCPHSTALGPDSCNTRLDCTRRRMQAWGTDSTELLHMHARMSAAHVREPLSATKALGQPAGQHGDCFNWILSWWEAPPPQHLRHRSTHLLHPSGTCSTPTHLLGLPRWSTLPFTRRRQSSTNQAPIKWQSRSNQVAITLPSHGGGGGDGGVRHCWQRHCWLLEMGERNRRHPHRQSSGNQVEIK